MIFVHLPLTALLSTIYKHSEEPLLSLLESLYEKQEVPTLYDPNDPRNPSGLCRTCRKRRPCPKHQDASLKRQMELEHELEGENKALDYKREENSS
jgi:hypothetical protein